MENPIDVSDIKFVINLDFPNNTEDYVHRIGRTARAKNTGTAYSFFTSANAKQAKELIELLREAKQQIEPKLYEMMQLAKTFANGRSMYCDVEFFNIAIYYRGHGVPTSILFSFFWYSWLVTFLMIW